MARRTGNNSAEFPSEGNVIFRWKESHCTTEKFTMGRDVGRDHRHAHRKALQWCQAEAFEATGRDDDSGMPVGIENLVVRGPGPGQFELHAELRRDAAKRVCLRSLPQDPDAGSRLEPRGGAENHRVVLVGDQAGNRQDGER